MTACTRQLILTDVTRKLLAEGDKDAAHLAARLAMTRGQCATCFVTDCPLRPTAREQQQRRGE
jgi:hypothetical protein